MRCAARQVIADHLERLAGGLLILADHQQLGRFPDLDAIALGRDALGLRALPQRAAERLARPGAAQLRIVAGPAHGVAQRGDLGVPGRCACGARDVHAHRAVVLARERVPFRRELDVSRGLGRDGGAIVGGEHPAKEAHGASIATAGSG